MGNRKKRDEGWRKKYLELKLDGAKKGEEEEEIERVYSLYFTIMIKL
jgi:hypothetical protein